jgi:hypothetical protein
MWTGADLDCPANSSPRQKLEFAVKYAALAPMEANTRPWDFRLGESQLDLMARDTSALEAVDPDGRDSMVACGAALVFLKIALRHLGASGRVALFPDLDQPTLVARIHYGSCGERARQEEFPFESATRSRETVSTLGNTPVSETILTALSQAVGGEHAWLDFILSETSRQRVMAIRRADYQPWMDSASSYARPMNASSHRNELSWSRRFFSFGSRKLRSQNVTAEPSQQIQLPDATLAVVKTKTDDKYGWLAAGQTKARIVLHAQKLGLSCGLFNPMRRREAREALRVGVGHKGFAQLIFDFAPLTTSEMVQKAATTTAFATLR